ncbi:MAG: 3'-phosphoesterase [Candidatus Acetothermia bacterium]|jgi:DNA ligase D-like protein (predicted 3'-phosphoesterase)|nr:3'-phosphoesterase [Candidatus Acetothermia bacterium]MDH7505934.1 DNA polymerase ligase N-terminal domain-containing protein [Candidatus Acetothermia bacterium]
MSLEEYKKKRDFAKTGEPAGGGEPGSHPHDKPIYVVQKHHATHLHYDLRLEHDGVLKSWAVPKGPPTAPGERRLAVEVEDHPLEYADFEGVIPEGQYGAGRVELWDRGWFEPLKWAADEIVVEIHGERLQGRYALIRFQKEKDPKNWLLLRKRA